MNDTINNTEKVDDFEMMLRRLVHSIKSGSANTVDLAEKADDLLKRKGNSSPLRSCDESICPHGSFPISEESCRAKLREVIDEAIDAAMQPQEGAQS